VSSILSNGANIELADDDGTTCFMATACNDKDEKYAVEIMKMLLRDEKPSMKLLNACDKEGNTALIHAAKEGKFKLVKLLASRKRINPNIENEKSDSALSYAVRHSLEMVKVLLDAGAVVTGNSGAIALLHARAAKPEVMEALLDSRSDWGRVKGDELLLMYVSMNEGGEELIKRVQAKVLECAEGASDEADADDIASAPDAKTGKSSASGKKRKR
jgi:ankyrin repeat protein